MPRNVSCWPRTPRTDVELWFVLDTSRTHGRDSSIEQQHGTDLCTDVGVLNLADYTVAAASVLSGINTERARCIVVALAACAAAGTVRRCAEAATDYIRTREQFGRPVGAFQALQHKAAVLLVNAELAGSRRLGCGARHTTNPSSSTGWPRRRPP